ncbi:unnamed protein product [Blepharisma stoltei]|uniref:carbonic anhydrase n=1 Tax=Blepharisma stoltei TaxID=1481888 RepID=A0AAU9KCP8_9CILI|nr:unnamed protein product [Blepharisma stoltei]
MALTLLMSFLGIAASQSFSYDYHGVEWSSYCVNGLSQSPINITKAYDGLELHENDNDANYAYFKLDWSERHLKPTYNPFVNFVLNSDFGFSNLTSADEVLIDSYHIQTIKVHYPSEHRFNNDGSDIYALTNPNEMEVQFEHKSLTTGNVMILAIIYEWGSSNFFIESLIDSFNNPSGATIRMPEAIPGPKYLWNYYNYTGSYTVPSCGEGITWVVKTHKETASLEQLDFFRGILMANYSGGNYRYAQPLNNRTIYKYSSDSGASAIFMIFGGLVLSFLA